MVISRKKMPGLKSLTAGLVPVICYILTIGFYVNPTACLSLDLSRVPDLITNQCYNGSTLLGQDYNHVHGQTLENFISLVETIERRLEQDGRRMSAVELARALLKR